MISLDFITIRTKGNVYPVEIGPLAHITNTVEIGNVFIGDLPLKDPKLKQYGPKPRRKYPKPR